jgi:hypothetical protein
MDTAEQIGEMLAVKEKLDRLPEVDGPDQFAKRFSWLMAAVELLLSIELQRHEY